MIDYTQLNQFSQELNVLYVEDNVSLLLETADLLGSFFTFLETAQNGEEGLKKYTQHYQENKKFFDLVITDINMPIKDGISMIQDIKKENPEQVIIVTSAHNESEKLLELIQLRINSFIIKPLEPSHLLSVLYEACQNISNAKQREKFLQSQSKLALMGTMIENVAHQWRQPLAEINSTVFSIDNELNSNAVHSLSLEEKLFNIESLTQYMSQTISDFQNFFDPKKDKENFNFTQLIQNSIAIIKGNLKAKDIQVDIDIDDSLSYFAKASELQQVLLILFNNAIYILEYNKIQKPLISIKLTKNNDHYVLTICDNAGKADDTSFTKIFEPYFTTKANGIGLGLSIAKMIIEKSFSGEITAQNDRNGSCFYIHLPQKELDG